VYDSKEEDLLSNFESAINFINEGRTRGAVLVHWYSHTHTHTHHTQHRTHARARDTRNAHTFACNVFINDSMAGVSRSATIVIGT
jgi:hypothetical protein